MVEILHPRFTAADGDTRQLYALDRSAPSARLYFLSEGSAEAARPDVRAGMLVCPYPRCPQPLYTVRGGSNRRHHFAHRPGGVKHSPESWHHFSAKRIIGDWAKAGGIGPVTRVQVDDESVDNGQRPDVLIELVGGQLVAVEVQYAALTCDDWRRRHRGYQNHGIHDIWLLGHTGAQLRIIRRGTEETDLTFRMSDLHRAMLTDGVLPFWIDPDNQTVGTPWVSAGAPHLQRLDERGDNGVGPPTAESRHAQLAANFLTACRFQDNELVTPKLSECGNF